MKDNDRLKKKKFVFYEDSALTKSTACGETTVKKH